jgi:hypothetical protein
MKESPRIGAERLFPFSSFESRVRKNTDVEADYFVQRMDEV